MADTNYYTKFQQQKQANTSKFYSHFLFKALTVTIFLVILPLFPSQAPEFINQTLNTRGWEFLHLVFVGIAVSYGLFSRRNEETEKESSSLSKLDNAQSYVSRFLQVSSVFDDGADSPPRSDPDKVQTWSSQYYRNDPLVVVAEDHSALEEEQRATSSRISDKPLLLPVRSLKSRVVDDVVNDTSESLSTVSGSLGRSSSNSGSKRFSTSSSKRRIEFGGLENLESEEKVKDNVVLPSPIPWRSRSGRMEMREVDSPLYTLPPMEQSENNRSFKSQVSRSSRSSSTSSSPKLSPSPSMSSPKKSSSPAPPLAVETQGKIAEDFTRKKGFYRSPPPPPPPPPPIIRKSSSMRPTFGAAAVDDDDDEVIIEKSLKPSLSMAKSVRTTRRYDSFSEEEFEVGIKTKADERAKELEAAAMGRGGQNRVRFGQSSSFKSERLNREHVSHTAMEFPEKGEEHEEKLTVESDEDSETEEEDQIAANSYVSGVAASSYKEESSSSGSSDGGPDVDKKAAEFIAKFREQIRLQRIESIKQSSSQISRKAAR